MTLESWTPVSALRFREATRTLQSGVPDNLRGCWSRLYPKTSRSKYQSICLLSVSVGASCACVLLSTPTRLHPTYISLPKPRVLHIHHLMPIFVVISRWHFWIGGFLRLGGRARLAFAGVEALVVFGLHVVLFLHTSRASYILYSMHFFVEWLGSRLEARGQMQKEHRA